MPHFVYMKSRFTWLVEEWIFSGGHVDGKCGVYLRKQICFPQFKKAVSFSKDQFIIRKDKVKSTKGPQRSATVRYWVSTHSHGLSAIIKWRLLWRFLLECILTCLWTKYIFVLIYNLHFHKMRGNWN